VPTTTNFALRYPSSASTVAVHTDMQNLATDVDTQLLAVKNPPASVLTRNTNLSINSGVFTDVTWPTEEFDNASLSAAGGATITIPAGGTGFWQVSANVIWAANAAGTRSLVLQVNGVAPPGAGVEQPPSGSSATRQGFSVGIKLTAGDVIKVQGFQSVGGAINITEGRFSAVRLSA
jgi:hypothetical protein